MKYILAIILTITVAEAQSLRRSYGADIPEGAIMAFARVSCPEGFLEANGSQVSRTQYSKLFSAISTIHGSGNGSTTFHLPDYRGRFLRGFDGSAGNDPDKASRTAMNAGGAVGNNVGSIQEDMFQSHNHYTNSSGNSALINNNFALGSNAIAITGAAGANVPFPPTSDSVGGAVRTGAESRPRNAYVIFCIKI